MREAAAFADWLKSEDRFTLIAHQSPDGDTLGSSLALYAILRAMGKTVQVVCEHEMPYLYAFLPNAEAVRRIENCDPAYSNVISVDCADEKRMGTALPLFAVAAKRGNIDHHLTNSRFGEYVIHSERAAATAELVYRLWQALGVAQTGPEAQQIALCLYTGICTDTGSFSYSNTTPETFRISAELLAHGIDIASINRQLYRRIPIRKAKMLGHVLNTLQFLENGSIVHATVLRGDMQSAQATSEDIEGMIEYLRDIETVEIAILFRESAEGCFKVSLRSKEYADVALLAEKFGGGGHTRAAGCMLHGEQQRVCQEFLQAAQEVLR